MIRIKIIKTGMTQKKQYGQSDGGNAKTMVLA
jgi:hypothetical protein